MRVIEFESESLQDGIHSETKKCTGKRGAILRPSSQGENQACGKPVGIQFFYRQLIVDFRDMTKLMCKH